MLFSVGDFIELNENVLFFPKGLRCQVVKLEEGHCGYVKIIGGTKDNTLVGQTKYANLTLFKLVRRGGLYV